MGSLGFCSSRRALLLHSLSCLFFSLLTEVLCSTLSNSLSTYGVGNHISFSGRPSGFPFLTHSVCGPCSFFHWPYEFLVRRRYENFSLKAFTCSELSTVAMLESLGLCLMAGRDSFLYSRGTYLFLVQLISVLSVGKSLNTKPLVN